MRDDEDVGALQGGRVERALDVRGDREVALAQGRRGARERGVARVRRLDRLGHFRPDGPRLRMGLVEEHSRELGHVLRVRLLAADVVANCCNNMTLWTPSTIESLRFSSRTR